MPKPNLLLILTDQQRADTLHCAGNDLIQTPNLDRLAQRGVRFTQVYTEVPVCVPARQNIMTGRHAHTLGIMANAPTPGQEIPTLPGLLTEQGYFTQAIGKMHFRPPRNHYGFQRMLLSEEIPRYRQDDEFLMYLKEKGLGHIEEPHGQRHELYYEPQVSPLTEEHHTTAWTADRTVELIEQNRNRPFFCFTSFIKPHPPWDPPKPYHEMYAESDAPMPFRQESDRDPLDNFLLKQNHGKGVDNPNDELIRTIRARYYGMVTHIDRNIGKILDALDHWDLTENTIIIFTTDHGDLLGDHYVWGKRCFYESAAHIPFIVSWPGQFPEGEAREHLVTLCDILPTFLAHGGCELPPEAAGADLTPVIKDASAPWRKHIIGEFGEDRMTKFMVRKGDWKYIYIANGAREQLFNLREDPCELKNLAAEAKDVRNELRQILIDHYTKEGYKGAVSNGELIAFPFKPFDLGEINQQFAVWPQNESK